MRAEWQIIEAHCRAEREVHRRLVELTDILDACNYGLAMDHVRALIEDGRHDTGAQEFHPMLDRHLAVLAGGAGNSDGSHRA